MIKIKNGNVQFTGARIDLCAELTTIMNAFLEQGVCDKEALDVMVRVAGMDDKQLDEEMLKNLSEMEKALDKIIKDLSK